ncbi:MAG: hypothetical protein ACR2MW_07810 [Chthoniobacterales bacterium]
MPSPQPNLLRRCAHGAQLLLEVAVLSALILGTRCANHADVFMGGQVYFIDADCYSRMTRVRLVAAHPGLIVRHQNFENFPEGTIPHTTAPLDYLIVGLAALLGLFVRQPLDLAGAWISPLLALGAGWFLWWWSRRARRPYRWVGLLLFGLSPILAHGTALGRPDHQALLILLILVALAAEWSLGEKPSCGWALVSGLSWGLALWVSLYEPLLLLLLVIAGQAFRARASLLALERRAGWGALAGVLVLAALVERRLPAFPAAQLHEFFVHWSATIGELSRVGLTNPIWWQWLGGFFLLAPALLVVALARKQIAPWWVLVTAAMFALTLWQARWGYFLAVIFCLTTPVLIAVVRPRGLGALLAVIAFLPCLQAWDDTLWPNDTLAAERAARRREAMEWRDAAESLPQKERAPFLAPWWLSPSAAYWSGQPAVGGSSHESLPGIVASARFFLSTQPAEPEAILRARGVRWVLASDGERVAENSAAILGVPTPSQPLCLTLDRTPSRAPVVLTLASENGSAKLYRVRD